jgi:hypothetical protein
VAWQLPRGLHQGAGFLATPRAAGHQGYWEVFLDGNCYPEITTPNKNTVPALGPKDATRGHRAYYTPRELFLFSPGGARRNERPPIGRLRSI